MKQKIEELRLLLKNDRRIWAIVGLVFFVLFLWVITATPSRVPPQVASTPTQPSQTIADDSSAYKDLTLAYKEDIQQLIRARQEQDDRISRIASDLRDHQQRAKGIFETLVDQLEDIRRAVDRFEENQATQQTVGGLPPEAIEAPEIAQDSLEGFGFTEATVPPPPPAPKPSLAKVISPGDVVQLELLTGVNAPVDGTPYPVVFKLVGPVRGPDGSSLDLGEGRLIAAARGSESDGRALFRLTDLAIRHKDGRRSVVKVDGWVVGEDGIRGMRGRMIDKLGRLIAATAGVSFAAALGSRLEERADTIQVGGGENIDVTTGDLNFSTVSALTDASNRIGEILLNRYEQLVPVIEILPKRRVAAVFTVTAEVEAIDPADWEEAGIYTASLD